MRTDRIAGVGLALLGAAIGLEASTFEVAFMTDPVGPKALPYLVAALLVGGGVLLALRPGDGPAWPDRSTLARMAGAGGAFLAYAVVMPAAGFFLATTCVVAALSLLYGGPRVGSGLSAAALSGVLWLLFVSVLGLPLPIGTLWTR